MEFHAVSSPVSFTVFDSAGEVSFDLKTLVIQSGVDQPVTVRVKRLHDFKGEFTLELMPPSGSQGVSAASTSGPVTGGFQTPPRSCTLAVSAIQGSS